MADEESEEKRRKAPCESIRQDFKECILNSDCVVVRKVKPKQCALGHEDGVPEQCHNLRTLMFECKRSLLDARRRFRGRRDY